MKSRTTYSTDRGKKSAKRTRRTGGGVQVGEKEEEKKGCRIRE